MIRFLSIFLIFTTFVFSDVVLKAPTSFISGEALKFIIQYRGSEEPSFPDINKIDGFRVQKAGKSSQVSIMNGRRSESISQVYILYPNKDITIPEFEIKTSSNTFKTKAKKVKVQQASKSVSNNFDLSLSLDKDSLYVGEQAVLTLKFKFRQNLDILNMELNQPNFDGFWVKSLGKAKRSIENGFEIHTLKYMLFPQKAGKLKINPVSINVAVPDYSMRGYSFFNSQAKVKKIYSNGIDLDIKPLPDNLTLIGDFKISSTIDKDKVNFGQAVSFKIKIEGSGNLDDLDDIKLNIPNATIYENKPEKKYNFVNGKYSGTYTKTFSIVAQSSFNIDPIKLEFFDINTKTKKLIKTKSYSIQVLGAKKEEKQVVLQTAKPKIQKEVKKELVVKDITYKDKILFFVFGFICSVLLIFILYYIKTLKGKKKEEEKPLIKVIKSSSSKTDLLKTLSPYVTKDEELDSYIYNLEKIEDKDFKALKKDIIQRLKKLDF